MYLFKLSKWWLQCRPDLYKRKTNVVLNVHMCSIVNIILGWSLHCQPFHVVHNNYLCNGRIILAVLPPWTISKYSCYIFITTLRELMGDYVLLLSATTRNRCKIQYTESFCLDIEILMLDGFIFETWLWGWHCECHLTRTPLFYIIHILSQASWFR